MGHECFLSGGTGVTIRGSIHPLEWYAGVIVQPLEQSSGRPKQSFGCWNNRPTAGTIVRPSEQSSGHWNRRPDIESSPGRIRQLQQPRVTISGQRNKNKKTWDQEIFLIAHHFDCCWLSSVEMVTIRFWNKIFYFQIKFQHSNRVPILVYHLEYKVKWFIYLFSVARPPFWYI